MVLSSQSMHVRPATCARLAFELVSFLVSRVMFSLVSLGLSSVATTHSPPPPTSTSTKGNRESKMDAFILASFSLWCASGFELSSPKAFTRSREQMTSSYDAMQAAPLSYASVVAPVRTKCSWILHGKNQEQDSSADQNGLEELNVEVLSADEDEFSSDELDWIPDRIKSQARRLERRIPAVVEDDSSVEDGKKDRPSPYTDEEEDIISSMGGKAQSNRREAGYLGDSTLREIAMDYSVPVSYLADVLCMWGVFPPIQIDDVPLGDMVTGEQAFAILEAVNSLDVGALNDRYSNTNLRQLCFEYDIDLQDAFSMAVKEGWSLPFGVETCLRVEQEDELLRVLRHEGSEMTTYDLDNEDDEKYMYGDLS